MATRCYCADKDRNYAGYVKPEPQLADRPWTVSLIALFQGSLACYLLYFTATACLDPPAKLGYLRSALRLLVGRTDYRSYAKFSKADISVRLFFFATAALGAAVYCAVTGWGLWRLKKWARHSVSGICGIEVIYWLRSFLFFGIAGGFSRAPQSALQPVYIVFFIEAMIFMTLTFYGGVAEAFGEVE